MSADGGMQVTVLGSGTAVPVPDRFPAAHLVVAGVQALLVDLGPGALRRLAQTGVGLEQISTVLLTHYHTDHCADLAALLFALRNPRYAGRPPLQVLGAPGLHELYGHLCAAWPWLTPRDYELQLEEITPGVCQLGGLAVTAVPILHTDASLAYRIESRDGASAAFSGDADVCPGLAQVAQGVDLFVCDCAFPDGSYTAGHLTPGLAAAAAREAGVRTLCLTHFYPECDGHDLRAQARARFAGEVVLAADLMSFTLPARR